MLGGADLGGKDKPLLRGSILNPCFYVWRSLLGPFGFLGQSASTLRKLQLAFGGMK